MFGRFSESQESPAGVRKLHDLGSIDLNDCKNIRMEIPSMQNLSCDITIVPGARSLRDRGYGSGFKS